MINIVIEECLGYVITLFFTLVTQFAAMILRIAAGTVYSVGLQSASGVTAGAAATAVSVVGGMGVAHWLGVLLVVSGIVAVAVGVYSRLSPFVTAFRVQTILRGCVGVVALVFEYTWPFTATFIGVLSGKILFSMCTFFVVCVWRPIVLVTLRFFKGLAFALAAALAWFVCRVIGETRYRSLVTCIPMCVDSVVPGFRLGVLRLVVDGVEEQQKLAAYHITSYTVQDALFRAFQSSGLEVEFETLFAPYLVNIHTCTQGEALAKLLKLVQQIKVPEDPVLKLQDDVLKAQLRTCIRTTVGSSRLFRPEDFR